MILFNQLVVHKFEFLDLVTFQDLFLLLMKANDYLPLPPIFILVLLTLGFFPKQVLQIESVTPLISSDMIRFQSLWYQFSNEYVL
jgi:hypothetical protein